MRPLIERRLTAIYLQDHLAAATAGVELVRRARAQNPEGELGAFLELMATEIEEDRQTLVAIMSELGVEADRVKVSGAWAAEKLGRLKLNGRLAGYSPLSRLLELEGLVTAVSAKLSTWLNLRAGLGDRLVDFDLVELIARAQRQLDALRSHASDAAIEALAEERGATGAE
jgi:hypothetical protein